MEFGKCESENNNLKITLKEKGRIAEFSNPQQLKIRQIKVDKCLSFPGERCDYLLIRPDRVEFFVELKGKAVLHAVDQLTNSISNLSLSAKTQEKHMRVVCSGSPMDSATIGDLRKKMKMKFNSSFVVRTNKLMEDLDDPFK